MKKSNKIWLTSLGSFLGVTTPLIAISCGQIDERRYVFEFSSIYTPQPFLHDSSRSYGSYVAASTRQHTSTHLIRTQTLNQVSTVAKEIRNSDGTIKELKNLIIDPTWNKNKLELASAIYITDTEDKIHVFDNDEAEIRQEADLEFEGQKHYSNPAVFLKSNNAKSINSKNFEETLKKAKKIQFAIREGVNWINNEGNKTKYKLKAKDFYYSWLRTYFIKQSNRFNFGGSEELDKEAFESLAHNKNVSFTANESYDNEYLFELFGVDSSKFNNESTFIQKINGTNIEAVTFEKLDSSEAKFSEFISSTILRSTTFMPVSSEYLDEVNKDASFEVYDYLGSQNDKTKEFAKKLKTLDKNSLVYKTGSYWYGLSLKDSLFVGPYYIAPQSGQEVKMKKNTHFVDQEWAKAENNIREIVFIHNSNKPDPDTFSQRSFNKYKQGTLSQIGYSNLKPHQQAEMLRNPEKYGLRYNRTVNKSTPFYREVSQPFIRPLPNGQNVNYYGFNDAFAKLMYGGTREELSKGTNDPQAFISGTGLIFRTLYSAAINWDQLASQATGGEGFAWLAKVADGSSIGGSNQSSSTTKTPYEAREKINSLFAIKADGSGKVNFGEKYGEDLNPSENEKFVENKSEVSEKMKSAGFETIKKELEKLIKKFDEENPTLAGQDFEFQWFYMFINLPAQYENAFKNLQKVFNELNPRLKFSVFHTTNGDDPRFEQFRSGGANGTENIAWSYDYDSIGSGYDGLSWAGNLIPTITWIAANEANGKNKNIKDFYPEFYKLTQEIIKYEQKPEHKWIGSVPFKDLHLVENKFKTSRLPLTSQYVFEKDTEGIYRLKTEEKDGKKYPVSFKPEEGKKATDGWTWSAQFWLNYISSITNEDAIKLMTELTSYFNVNFTYSIFKNRNEFSKSLVQKHFVVPDETFLGASVYMDWKVNKTKK